MSYTYSTLTTALAAELSVDPADTDFVAILPTLIDDAEQRIYRELDLLASIVTVPGTVTANSRTFSLPTGSGHILVVDAINVKDASSIRHPVAPATRETIDAFWPSDTAPSAPSYPKYLARIDDATVLLGPPPDSAYSCEVIGTIRPAPLSSTNTTTFLTNYLSDLFFAACMISASGWMRNFGSQGDDPKMAVSWSSEYQAKLASAKSEELRKSYVSAMSAPPASVKDA